MGRQVAVILSDEEMASLDAAIAAGRFSSRPAALRAGLRRLLADDAAVEPWHQGLIHDVEVLPAPAAPHPVAIAARDVAIPALTSVALALAGRLLRHARSRPRRPAGPLLLSDPRLSDPRVFDPHVSAARYRSQLELLLVRRPPSTGR